MNKSPDQLIKEIDEIVRGLWSHLEDPETLSRDIAQLSVLNYGLGKALALVVGELIDLETDYKHDFEAAKLETMESPREDGKKVSATAAESVARVQLRELAEEIARLEKAVAAFKIQRSDTEQVIEAARSRLSLIKQDIRNG